MTDSVATFSKNRQLENTRSQKRTTWIKLFTHTNICTWVRYRGKRKRHIWIYNQRLEIDMCNLDGWRKNGWWWKQQQIENPKFYATSFVFVLFYFVAWWHSYGSVEMLMKKYRFLFSSISSESFICAFGMSYEYVLFCCVCMTVATLFFLNVTIFVSIFNAVNVIVF